MKYEDIAAALQEEEKLDAELGKVGEGVEEQLKPHRIRHGGDLDALDGVLWYRMLRNYKDIIKSGWIFIDNVRIP